jgi:hypothetical protein
MVRMLLLRGVIPFQSQAVLFLTRKSDKVMGEFGLGDFRGRLGKGRRRTTIEIMNKKIFYANLA